MLKTQILEDYWVNRLNSWLNFIFYNKITMTALKLSYYENLLQQLDNSERAQFHFFFRYNHKNILIAYLWLITLGIFGLHKFYLNQRRGWLYLLFFWTAIPALLAVIDLFLLPWQVHKYNKKLAARLVEYIRQLENNPAKLLQIDNKLRAKRVRGSEFAVALLVIFGVVLPLISYANLRLTAHRLEIHYKTNHLDGTQSDSFIVL